MELKKIRIAEIVPYENNPRKNDKAVEAVAESIKQCGYVAPIIIDEQNIILAGHTRYKALIKLGRKEAECVVRSGLTEEQKRKYRILDNKTNELAEWDFDKLAMELEGLSFDGFDFDLKQLDSLAEDFNKPVYPVFTPDEVVNTTNTTEDPYLPEAYNDYDIQEYTDRQEDYVVKRRIIITYLPEREPDVAKLLNKNSVEKVVYDIEEIL